MLRIGESIAVRKVEVLVVDVVQEHIDARQVVRGQVDFLPIEPLPNVLFSEHLRKLQQQRARTNGRVDEPDGPQPGTAFSWEDGNGIQKGWAGRWHP